MAGTGIIGSVKRRRGILLAVVGAVLAAVLVVALWPGEREPEYQGKKLSLWLNIYAAQGRTDPQGAEAVRHIGTNALPFLLRWIDYASPNRKDKLADAITRMPFPVFLQTPLVRTLSGERRNRASVAMFGFEILGKEAAPAVPALTQMLADGSSEERISRVLFALMYVGEEGLPPLVAVVTNKAVRTTCREMAAGCIAGRGTALGTNGNWAVRALVPCLKEEPALAAQVANVLGTWKLVPNEVVPALTTCLQSPETSVRVEAAKALGQFGTQASTVVPELLVATCDMIQSVRTAATNALMRIAPEVLTNAAH